jgi:catechol-2,3-dioxygenase
MKISRLTLYTKNLSGQKAFYGRALGLPFESETTGSVTILLRNTALTFIERPSATPYHFAINIPTDTVEQALRWLRGRAFLLTDDGEEIHEFPAWNARSVYFYDADENIVEFISRRNLGYTTEKEFSGDSLIEISEIGLAVNEIKPYYDTLKRIAGLELFDGNMEQFSAIGDEYGLFICINRLLKTWYPSGDKALPSGFEVAFTEKSRDYLARFENNELIINHNPG